MRRIPITLIVSFLVSLSPQAQAAYVNFESSHVHPIDLTPSGVRLLVVNTPDALLEVFTVSASGDLTPERSIPVGLEPVTVAARTDSEAWVVNNLSDTISIVDLGLGTVVRTLAVGDEPTDVVFAAGKAFVAVSQEDAVKVFNLADLTLPPVRVDLFGRDVRALAASSDGSKVYAVLLQSGNQTAVINANAIWGSGLNFDQARLTALGLHDIGCKNNLHPPYPQHPPGIARDTSLPDPPNGAQPPVGLIVRWDGASGRWLDDQGQDWSDCVPYRLPDHDLFVIDAANPTTASTVAVDHLGTSLFEVSVNPANGRVYIPNTEARNNVRFEHALGVRGHMVDNRMTIVDPGAGNAARIVDLNRHIVRTSDPATNLPERQASISQPGMMVWNGAGTFAYLTAIGSRKLFRVSQACLNGPGPDYGACVFGPSRATPDAVEVGEGPTGVALLEAGANRLYVLNRFSNSIALVDAPNLTKIGEVALHDPTPVVTRTGRRHLYDGIDSSGHGDAACSSCHLSGDKDGLAWDLGDPTGQFVAYGTTGDNVRFFPVDNPALAASHAGFDPEKGPMTTQTLRGMLEPLHWRGDRPTMNAFNKAFVGLMGTKDIGPINNEPAGVSAEVMEEFRQFALAQAFPPNPFRTVDDQVPNAVVSVPGLSNPGNPFLGQQRFLGTTGAATDGGIFCVGCHALPFGANGGKIGGIEPGDPPGARAALFNGDADGSPHSDLKIPHMRNLYEKIGPRFGDVNNAADRPDQKSGFGLIHDGAIPDMNTFLSASVFNLTPDDVKNISAFSLMFPTGIRPSVGRNVTLPPGTPPTGPPPAENLLASLVALGNLADANRHCELTAAARSSGPGARERTWVLNGLGQGGLWTTDVAGEPQVTTTALREQAGGPITFTCATIGSGVRLGVDRDEDLTLNGNDCAPANPSEWALPGEVSGLQVDAATHLTWTALVPPDFAPLAYDVAGGNLSALPSGGFTLAGCLVGGVLTADWNDARPNPPSGDGYYYIVRAKKPCGAGPFGPSAGAVDALACSP